MTCTIFFILSLHSYSLHALRHPATLFLYEVPLIQALCISSFHTNRPWEVQTQLRSPFPGPTSFPSLPLMIELGNSSIIYHSSRREMISSVFRVTPKLQAAYGQSPILFREPPTLRDQG